MKQKTKMNKFNYLLVVTLSSVIIEVNSLVPFHGLPANQTNFCKGNDLIYARHISNLYEGIWIVIEKAITGASEIRVQLDSPATIKMGNNYHTEYEGRVYEADLVNNVFSFIVRRDYEQFVFTIKGRDLPLKPPYILSLKINGEENCKGTDWTYFESCYPDMYKAWPAAPDKTCGRRKIYKKSTALIINGSPSSTGSWPWHAAIFKTRRHITEYTCGGTLISKLLVLTAAHCATSSGVPMNPDILGVKLGKFILMDSESTAQDRQVGHVIVHEDFHKKNMNNDIALLKLTAEVMFNNYVQPACIWFDGVYDKLNSFEVKGTVAGWGIDQSDNLPKKLRETTMPIVPELTCVGYDPLFYRNALDGKKFCAGYNNGSTACNGDSGGGLMVFAEDDITNHPDNIAPGFAGAWYVKGIVSISLARDDDTTICDPRAYTILTDVAKYKDWILSRMN